MKPTVVHRLDLEDGKPSPRSPHCQQAVDWAEVNRQRHWAYGWLNERAKAVAHGPPLPVDMSPLWP